jgi:hypothetical protein
MKFSTLSQIAHGFSSLTQNHLASRDNFGTLPQIIWDEQFEKPHDFPRLVLMSGSRGFDSEVGCDFDVVVDVEVGVDLT